MNDLGLLLKALEFASQRHRSQTRKGSSKPPYINHPIEVASLLANEGGESDGVLLAAAILHDVIEDTVDSVAERSELTDEISSLFGQEVTALTLEVTDDKTLEKKDRKLLQVSEADKKTARAKKLKIADKIANLRDIIADPPDFWANERIIEYLNWSERVFTGLRGVNNDLDSLFIETLSEARKKYAP